MRAGDARRAELYNGCWEEHQNTSLVNAILHVNSSYAHASLYKATPGTLGTIEAGQNASRFYPISQTSRGRAWGALSRNLF
jgi:hypothetical protein